MEGRRTGRRGVAILAVAILVAGALAASSAGAAAPLTKAKVKKIATKVVNNLAPGIAASAIEGRKLYYRRGAVATVANVTTGFVGVECPAGTMAIGGGGVVEQANMLIESSYPARGTTPFAGFTGWALWVRNNSGSPGDIRAFVTCVDLGPADSNYAEGVDPH